MDNIIFLDIDGTLSSEKYFMANPDRKGDALFIEPEKVKILNELKDIPGITIVISSSWGKLQMVRLRDLDYKFLFLDTQIIIMKNGYAEEMELKKIYKTNIIEPAQSLVRAGGQIKTYITML